MSLFLSPWILVVFAGLLEVCWATSLKATHGFTRPLPTVFCVTTLIGSLVLLSMAVKHLPVGTAYAVWVGIGVTGAALVAPFLYQEPFTLVRGVLLLTLLGSILGLKLTA